MKFFFCFRVLITTYIRITPIPAQTFDLPDIGAPDEAKTSHIFRLNVHYLNMIVVVNALSRNFPIPLCVD